MTRGVYSHEQDDPDFAWLINNYKNTKKNCVLIDMHNLPIILISIPQVSEEPKDNFPNGQPERKENLLTDSFSSSEK
jgi:hypothetical protein